MTADTGIGSVVWLEVKVSCGEWVLDVCIRYRLAAMSKRHTELAAAMYYI